ncbi:MAG: hypothetical protein GY803_09990, partial [Chloroflexi bacterium]|nr:hypothetical protein [Chloroflexota bacterium]
MVDEFPPDTSTPPASGNAIFYEECRPPLEAGNYTLKLTQELATSSGGEALDKNSSKPLPDSRQHQFTITGPRFTLDPAEIHAAFPPPNSEGPFESRLPMVVLRRRTLPWERSIDAGGTPWLALLLFEEGEIKLLDPPDCTVAKIMAEDSSEGVLGLSLSVTQEESQQRCLGIQLPLSTFREVAPMPDEVDLLTHARQVNTDDKELLGMDKDGWFAVVVGNRLPEPGKKYIACLVSLEGHHNHLPTSHDELTAADVQPPFPFLTYQIGVQYDEAQKVWINLPPPPAIRLATLARWEFTCQGEGDFESLMKKIPQRGGVAMIGMSPKDAVPPDNVPTTAYNVALDSGHVPLAHQTREGENVISWYRGPLVPVGVDRDTSMGPYHTADQARRIDPLTGLENLGYAAAFEIGRLLALSDPNFALELLRWRRRGHQRVTKAITDGRLAAILPDLVHKFDPLKLIDPRFITKEIIQDVTDMIKGEVIGPLVDPTGLEAFRDELLGLDATAVAAATGYEAGVVSAIYSGSIAGSSGLLATLGIQDTISLEGNFDNLAETAVTEFGHLNAQREQMLQ